jgi:hypothetical protein
VIPLVAVSTIVELPPVPAAGVPDTVAVPLPLSVKLRPEGSVPKLGAMDVTVGVPLVVTSKLPAVPATNVALSPLVKAGAAPMFTVRF